MSIEINGKVYRNLQEQVQKNMEDIDKIKKGGGIDVYTKEESLNIFQTKIEMELYATQQQLNLNIAATEARTDLLLANKQDTLVSGTNIKTVNGNSLLGSGNIDTTYTAGYGIGINNDIIAIDQNIVALKNELNGYLKNNDLNYSGIFRGQAVYVKNEGAYTSTSYGDGSIGRTIPNQPGYAYTLPDKSGTFAMTSDIITISGLTMRNYKIVINDQYQYNFSVPYVFDTDLSKYDAIRKIPVNSIIVNITNHKTGIFRWQTGTIAVIYWSDNTSTPIDLTSGFDCAISANAPATM